MAGNFRGVLIFVIFVVDCSHENFHPRKLMPTVYTRGMTKNIVEARTTFSVLHVVIGNNRYCHPADGVFVTNIVLSHTVCPSFFAEVAW
jgi:hypothetical protein